MEYLIDTCTLLRVLARPSQLSKAVAKVIKASENEIWVHQFSFFEIQIKYGKGRLTLPKPPQLWLPKALKDHFPGYARLTDEDIFHLGKLPAIHGDPFDRLLVFDSIARGLTLLTPDPLIEPYACKQLW